MDERSERMPPCDDAVFRDIKVLLNTALQRFYEQDRVLFDFALAGAPASERCMVFRIGWHMLAIMKEQSIFPGMDLDCEYNRHLNDKKCMYMLTAELKTNEETLVIPDLLIHKRKTDESNILVAEFKKGRADLTDKANDQKKLCFFTDPHKCFKYCYGIYVELYGDYAEVEVYKGGEHRKESDYTMHFDPNYCSDID